MDISTWHICILLCTIRSFHADEVPLDVELPATIYRTCGSDAQIGWLHQTGVSQIKKITWYQIDDSGGLIDEIANHNNLVFTINEGSSYNPSKENRVEFLQNAGLTIKNLQPGDEGNIKVEVDFQNLNHSTGTTKLLVKVDLTLASPFEPSPTLSVLNQTSKSITCSVNGRPAPTITWFHNGALLSNDTNYAITESSLSGACDSTTVQSELTIIGVDITDAGNITCSAALTMDTIQYLNSSTNLVVEYPPGSITATSANFSSKSVNNGQTTILNCQAFSLPAPSYQIWRNGAVIASGSANTYGVFSYTLGPLEFYDDGNYTCTATNSHGYDSVNVTLSVSVSPIITEISNSLTEIDDGSELVLGCVAKADPLTSSNMNWTKIYGTTSTFTETPTVVYSNSSIIYINNTLKIASVSKDDYGQYRCYADNGLGSTSNTVWVWIRCAPTITSSTIPRPLVIYNEYDTATYTCIAKGYPRPNITWKEDGNLLMENITEVASNTTGVWVVTSTINLVFEKSFAGQLGCYVSNGIAPDDSNITDVYINYRPEITLTALDKDMYSLDGKVSFAAATNDSVILYCSVKSYTPSTIKWFKNTVDITHLVDKNETETVINDFTKIKTSWISISSIEEKDNQDEYRCDATASGLEAISDVVRVLVLNGDFTIKPADLTCAAVGDTVFLDWRFYYTQPFDDIKWEKTEDINGTTDFVIGYLTNDGNPVSFKDISKYDYKAETKSGLYVKNVELADEGYYSVKINFDNSAVVFHHIVYLLVVVNPYKLVISPSQQVAVEGGNLSISCTVVGKPAPTIKWYKMPNHTSPLPNDGFHYIINSSEVPWVGNETLVQSELTLLSVTDQDYGNYSCEVSNKLTAISDYINITIYYPPKDTNLTNSTNIPALEGGQLVLTCATNALPLPVYYKIYLDGVLVHNSTNGTMVIDPTFYYHAGLYECVPYNLIGHGDNATLLVTVNVPPVLVDSTSFVEGVVGESSNFSCPFYGNPEPTVYWIKLSGGTSNTISQSDLVYHSNSSVFFKNSTISYASVVEQDYGEYQCYANNTYGYAVHNITFVVYHKVQITSHTLVQPSDNQTAGDSVIRECVANGYPGPITIQWYLNNIQITRHPSSTQIVNQTSNTITVKSTLTMSNIDKDDRGDLECRASNSIGSDNETTNFEVLFPPELTSTPSAVEYENDQAILDVTCVAMGNEIPVINWYKNGVLISHGGIYQINNFEIPNNLIATSTLTINPVSKDTAGTYTCNATNSHGHDSFVSDVQILYPPEIFDFPVSVLTANEAEVDYTLKCAAIGNPQPSVTWYQNGTLLEFPHPRYNSTITMYNDTAVVHEVKIWSVAEEDYGNWTCKAENTNAGNVLISDSENTLLTITYDPRFLLDYPQAIYYSNATDSAILICRMKSHPAPISVSWQIPASDPRYSVVTNTVEQTDKFSIVEQVLTISPVNESDFGNFTCVGTNGIGTVNTSALLIIYYKGSADTFQEITLNEGESLWLHVPSVVSNPLSNFTYYFNGSLLNRTDHLFIEHVNSTSAIRNEQSTLLTDSSVDYLNSGIYRIEACNVIGCQINEWKVIVEFQPVLQTTMDPLTHINVSNTLTLQCTFLGNPIPGIITWKHKGVTLSNNPPISISQSTTYTSDFSSEVVSTIQVPNILKDDGMDYVCTATNSLGSTSGTYNVSVCHPPVIINDLTDGVLRITEGSDVVFSFTVDSNPQSTFQWRVNNSQNVMTSPQVVSNPLPVPWYTIRQTADVTDTMATRNMSGEYNVTVCNLLGCVDSKTTTLIIEYPPNIQQINDVTVQQSENGTFTCIADGEPGPITIHWFFNGTGPLTTNAHQTISTSTTSVSTYKTEVTSTITLWDVQRISDVGKYTCKAMNAIGSTEDDSHLLVSYPPSEVSPLVNLEVDEGSPFTFVYDVRSQPAVSYYWLHNGTEVQQPDYTIDTQITQSTLFDVFTQSKLSGNAATRSQAGIYTVYANNSVGNIQDTANLIVRYPPTVSNLPNRTILEQPSAPASLVCDAESYPMSSIEWYKNGIKMSDTFGNIEISSSVVLNSTFDKIVQSKLTFTSLSKIDSANYTCTATNPLGQSSLTTYMIVHYPPVIVPDFPPSTYTVVENSLKGLKCNVDSNPVSLVQWYFSPDGNDFQPVTGAWSQELKIVPFPEIEVIYNTSYLFLPNNVQKTHAGYYRCEAENYLGTSAKQVQLNVQFAPDFVAPGTMNGVEDTTPSSSTQFVCKIESNPEANIIWLKDGSPISSTLYNTTVNKILNGNIMTKESTLSFTNIQFSDHGNYTCQAANSVGTSMQSKSLNVIYPPVTTTLSRTVYYNDGETVLLNCSATGNPIPTYHWTKPDSTTDQGHTLTFNAETSKEGNYTCIPKNSAGDGSPVILQLLVSVAPSNTNAIVCKTASQQTTCTCSTSGYPIPTVYWTKYGNSIIVANGSQLILPENEANDGTYMCHATNPGGTVSSSVAVAVFGSLITTWTVWSGCNNTCGSGSKFRTRLCNNPSCLETLIETSACIGDCVGKVIPIMDAFEDDPWIALYILAPLALVAAVVCVVYLARRHGSPDDSALIIPATAASTANLTQIYPNRVDNLGYGSLMSEPEHESLEVNLMFDDDIQDMDSIDSPDNNFDQLDNRRPYSESFAMDNFTMDSFTMDTPSIQSDNCYEELEPM